jgi:hypothetical protein
MDKEQIMSKAKSGALLATLFLCAGLIGCQGDNTFKRESNPVKDYTSVLNDAQPYVPGQVNKTPPAPDNSQLACYEPFKVSVERDQGNKLLFFTEEIQGRYVINVRSLIDQNLPWDIKAVDLPAGSSFRRVSKSGNTASFEFVWTPAKGRTTDVDLKVLTLRYISIAESKCQSGPITQSLNLVVKKNDGEPAVSFAGLPDQAIRLGDTFSFQIKITDPAGTAEAAPDLKEIAFNAGATSGERAVLNAKAAVSCGETGRFDKSSWLFDCRFDSAKLNSKQVEAAAKQQGVVEAMFTATAYSKRSHRTSAATPAYVRLSSAAAASASTDATSSNAGDEFGPTPEQEKSIKSIPIPTPRPDPKVLQKAGA